MSEGRKEKLVKIAFILNGFVFLMGGITLIDEGKAWFGVVQLIAALLNFLLLLRRLSPSWSHRLYYLLFVMNIGVATIIAIDYFNSDKVYLPYVWILVVVLTFIALVIYHKNKKAQDVT